MSSTRRSSFRLWLILPAAAILIRVAMAPAMMLALWGTVFQGVPVPDLHQLLRQHVSLLLGSLGKE